MNIIFLNYSKQSVNKPVNGTSGPSRNVPSPRPNVNGNGDIYKYVIVQIFSIKQSPLI